MEGAAGAPSAPAPPVPRPAEAGERRRGRRAGAAPGPAAPGAELRRAWRSGRAEAALQTELADAEAGGRLQAVKASFPQGAAQLLEVGQPLESLWAKVVTQFGGGRASISLQFVLKPRKVDDAEGPAAQRQKWHFLVRARELGRTTSGDDEEKHWTARLVLGSRPRGEGSIAAVIPDHRSVWPECREVHSEHALAAGDPILEMLQTGNCVEWDVAVAVRDAGAPLEGMARDFGDCC